MEAAYLTVVPPATGVPAFESLGAQRRRLISLARLRCWLLVACFAIGIVIANFVHQHGIAWRSWIGFALVGSLAIVAAFVPTRASRVVMIIAILAMGASFAQSRIFERPADNLRVLMGIENAGSTSARSQHSEVLDVEGFLPSSWERVLAPQGELAQFQIREPSWSADLLIRRALMRVGSGTETAWVRASGRLRVVVVGNMPPSHGAGASIRATGQFIPPDRSDNPGDEKRLLFEAQDRHAGILRCTSPELIHEAEAAGVVDQAHSTFARASGALRARLRRVLDSASNSRAASQSQSRQLLGALLLGERELERGPVGLAYTRLGLSHILTISGFHLMVLALTGLWVVRLTGDRGWLEPTLVAVLVIVYVTALPAQSPIIRSALMVLSVLASDALGRKYDRVCVLAWVAFALLIWRPADLWSLGFQLSAGLTAMLLWAGEFAPQAIFGTSLKGTMPSLDNPGFVARTKSTFALAISNGAMCWLTSLPIVASTTGLLSLAGMIASLLLAPFFVLLLWIGYFALMLGMLSARLASLGGFVLEVLCSLSVRGATWMDSFSLSSLRVPPVPFWWSIPMTAMIAMCWRMWSTWTRCARRNTVLVAGLWCLTLVPVALLARGLPTSHALRVDMLAVGDGSCFLIRSGTDALLWDAKALPPRGATPRAAAIARELGAWRVRRVLISHPDIDHMGGVLDLLEPLGVEQVLIDQRMQQQALEQPEGAAAVVLRVLESRDVKVQVVIAGDQLHVGRATMTFLSPPSDAAWKVDNEHSLVALVEAPRAHAEKPARLLMTGDAGPLAITMLQQRELPPIDAMELPHHGSAQPAAMEWVQSLHPRVILQSTGPSRVDDPRWDETRTALPNAQWFSTPANGCTSVTWKHDGTIVTKTMR